MTSAKFRTRTDPAAGISWKPGVVAAAAPRETVYAPTPPNPDAASQRSLARLVSATLMVLSLNSVRLIFFSPDVTDALYN